jgi:hypothetical protein
MDSSEGSFGLIGLCSIGGLLEGVIGIGLVLLITGTVVLMIGESTV